MTLLTNMELFRPKAFVSGGWVKAASCDTFDVTNPATGALLGTVPNMGREETETAIADAKGARISWSSKYPAERGTFLEASHDLIQQHWDDLTLLLTLEMGKPLAEALGEINYGLRSSSGLPKRCDASAARPFHLRDLIVASSL